MKTKSIIIAIIVSVLFAIGSFQALGQDAEAQNVRASYEKSLKVYTDRCNSKSEMLNSKSDNLRKAALRSCMKASFCSIYKDELIDELIVNNIELKPYKIQLFINQKFETAMSEIMVAKR